MFTGIIKAIAPILELHATAHLLRYTIAFPIEMLHKLEIGASVAVDGVCQTVVAIEQQKVSFEAIEETLLRTTLKNLSKGTRVNLERAAKFGEEIGGHLLSGHIACTASIENIENNVITLKCSLEWIKYLFPKGFVALNGASLTLVSVLPEEGLFTVHLIPETLKRTTWGDKSEGDLVNLEVDSLTQAVVETVARMR